MAAAARLPLWVRSRGGLWGAEVKGGEPGGGKVACVSAFVLRWLLLLIFKRQAGKARTLGVYL